ncbi:MAG TPA: hypothetical protein VNX28_16570 [Gemmataceae bacterium]|nr:hypothetical protein [Gemmataceae bacterium]
MSDSFEKILKKHNMTPTPRLTKAFARLNKVLRAKAALGRLVKLHTSKPAKTMKPLGAGRQRPTSTSTNTATSETPPATSSSDQEPQQPLGGQYPAQADQDPGNLPQVADQPLEQQAKPAAGLDAEEE